MSVCWPGRPLPFHNRAALLKLNIERWMFREKHPTLLRCAMTRRLNSALGEPAILDPVRPVGLDAEAALSVLFVCLVIPFEPDDAAVSFEREDVRGGTSGRG